MLAQILQWILNLKFVYDKIQIRDTPDIGPGINVRERLESDFGSLSQTNNTSYPKGIGKRKKPLYGSSQCCSTAHARGIVKLFPEISGPEDQILNIIDDQSKMTYQEWMSEMKWQDCPAARGIFEYAGNPVSCNANFAALTVLLDGYGLPLKPLDSQDEDMYCDGSPRLQEFEDLTADEYRELFEDVFAALGPRDFVVCLVRPTAGGHYVGAVEMDQDGLFLDDPYGTMFRTKRGYSAVHERVGPERGTRLHWTWDELTRKHKQPASRIHILRFK